MSSVRVFAASIAAALIFAIGNASAQTYPDRPVTMIVAFPPAALTTNCTHPSGSDAEGARPADCDREHRRRRAE